MTLGGFWSHLFLAGSPAVSHSNAFQSIDFCDSIIFKFIYLFLSFFISLCLCVFLLFIILILPTLDIAA
jgi:hypothetical protein